MNGTGEERLYNLLPALYRRRDVAAGEALRALMSVLEGELRTLEADIGASYDNWFVETCDGWVLPYIAELVGIGDLSQEKHVFSTQRRQVANTIAYRSHKGTLAALEHVLRDATAWRACAVEYYQRLAVTQHLARVRRGQGCTVDLRRTTALAELDGPFDELAHTADVRSVTPEPSGGSRPGPLRQGKYGPGNLGLFFWRLCSYRMTHSRPHSMAVPTLLDFLNQAKCASEIAQRIGDDPDFGSSSERAYGVRPSLARRILEQRDRLPNRRFESLEQVDAVWGMGPDTLHDMLASFPGLYSFHPLSVDLPLFNWPQYITGIDQRVASLHVPLALSRAGFAADLEGYEAQFGHWPEKVRPTNSCYYGPERGLNVSGQVWSGDGSRLESASIPPAAVLSTDLSQWDQARADRVCERYPTKQVAIDVQLGRLALLNPPQADTNPPVTDENIVVTYCYGFSAAMGGGPYHRQLPRLYSATPLLHIDVAKGAGGINDPTTEAVPRPNGAVAPACVPTLRAALAYWEASWGGQENPRGVIRILDNGVYDEELEIRLPKGAELFIVADNGVRPVIGENGPLTVVCEDEGAQADGDTGAERRLHLNGLLIHGGLQIGSGGHREAVGRLIVTLEHCTLVNTEDRALKPAAIEVKLASEDVRGLEISIERSVVGPLYLPPTTESLRVRHSIVDNGSGYAIAAASTGARPGPALNLERSTLFGQVLARSVSACDVIFGSPLSAPAPETEDQIQYSYVPVGSTTLEGEPHPAISWELAAPRFTSTRYGDPAYAQLSLDCPREIRGGAADGSEMGAFHDLYQVQAEANLRATLDEYLPSGLHAGIFYVT